MNVSKKTQGIIGLLMVVAAAGGAWQLREPARPGWDLSSIDRVPAPSQPVEPTAAGRPLDLLAPGAESAELPIPLQPDDSGQGGSTARGRVARMYYRTHENIYIAAEHTPAMQRQPDRLYAEVEYPDRLKSGALSVLTRVDERFGDVRIGDVVDLRIAHKHDAKNFPVRETTRVTALVARSDTMLARAFDTRIASRKAADSVASSQPQTLSQALGTSAAK